MIEKCVQINERRTNDVIKEWCVCECSSNKLNWLQSNENAGKESTIPVYKCISNTLSCLCRRCPSVGWVKRLLKMYGVFTWTEFSFSFCIFIVNFLHFSCDVHGFQSNNNPKFRAKCYGQNDKKVSILRWKCRRTWLGFYHIFYFAEKKSTHNL